MTTSIPWQAAIDRVSGEIAALEKKRQAINTALEKKRQNLASLTVRKSIMDSKRRPAVVAPGKKITAKNLSAMWAWDAIYKRFTEPEMYDHLPRYAVTLAMQLALPSMKPATHRSYLNRFIQQGLLARSPGGIAITEKGRASKA